MVKIMTKKSTQKQTKIRKGSKGRLDNTEWGQWCLFTLIYFIAYAIFGGFIKEKLADIYYIGQIPLDLQEGIWWLGLALYGMLSVGLNIKYKAE